MTDYANHWHADAWEARACRDDDPGYDDDRDGTDDTPCDECGEWRAYCRCEQEVCDDDE